MSLFATKRLVYLHAGKGEAAKEGGAEAATGKEKPKSVNESRAEAKIALEDARAEMANIEKNFGTADKKSELPKSAPPKIVEHYNKLKEIVSALAAASKHEQDLIEDTLQQFDAVMGRLEEFAKVPEASIGDPLAPLGYSPRRFESRVTRMPTPKKAPAPGAEDGAKKPAESKEEKIDRVIAAIIAKAENGDKALTAEEAKAIQARIKPGDLLFVDGQKGETYDLELSADKKFLRVNGDLGPSPESGIKSEKFSTTMLLDEKFAGEPKFRFKTDKQITDEKLAANKKDMVSQSAWLESEQAPLGSVVIVSASEITRKNPDSGATEKGYQSIGVKKGVDGLRLVTLQYFVDESGAVTPIMEVKSDKYDAGKVADLVSAKPIDSYEGTAMDKKEELRKKIDSLLHDLVAYLPLGGESSPNFQGKLREIKAVCDKYNISKRTYKDNILGLIVKVEGGKVSMLDPAKKNPAYKNPEETPDLPQYAYGAGTNGPIDLGKYA